MKAQQPTMSPLDVVVLLKIISMGDQHWNQKTLAEALFMSQSEISKSFARSKYAGLLDSSGKHVRKLALMEFLQYGIAYVYPMQPGAIVRGIPTAHSAAPLRELIQSAEPYVWPSGKGTLRGQSIVPLYPSVVDAVQNDSKLHELLALVDSLRVGKAREKELAIAELRKRILNGE
jgi:predicted transcriptional regulator